MDPTRKIRKRPRGMPDRRAVALVAAAAATALIVTVAALGAPVAGPPTIANEPAPRGVPAASTLLATGGVPAPRRGPPARVGTNHVPTSRPLRMALVVEPAPHPAPPTTRAPAGTPSAPRATPAPAPTPAHTAGTTVAAPALDAVCTLPADQPGPPTVQLAYPARWHVVGVDGRCGFFDADSAEEVPAGTDWFHADVVWKYDFVAFDGAPDSSATETVTSVASATIADRAAVRVTSTATGEGLHPAGQRSTNWVVDLGEVDGRPVVLFGAANGPDDLDDYRRAVDVLDEMAARLVIAGP